MNLLK